MSDIILPTWSDLDDLFAAASSRLLVCTPFYSEGGLGHIERNVASKVTVHVRVRLSPTDWASGISDPEGLLILLDILSGRGCEIDLGVNQRLHAKVYAADDSLVLLGSANLTSGGFGNNFELMSRMTGDEARNATEVIDRGLKPNLRAVSFSSLVKWVEDARADVSRAREMEQNDTDDAGEILDAAQSRLDSMLGYGSTETSGAHEPTPSDYDRFLDWLQRHSMLPGADMVIARARNKQRNSGKVKQSFYGGYRFLMQNSTYIDQLRSDLQALRASDIYAFDDAALAAAWANYLDAHALDKTDFYSYPTLRNYLTANLGGTCHGGGGGGSTFKRVMPLIAEYMGQSAS